MSASCFIICKISFNNAKHTVSFIDLNSSVYIKRYIGLKSNTQFLKDDGQRFLWKVCKSNFEQFITMQTRVGSTNG